MTFYTFDMILGGASAAFAVIAMFLHLLNHATHLSVPREQLKYVHHQSSYVIKSYSARLDLLTYLAFIQDHESRSPRAYLLYLLLPLHLFT